MTLIIRLSRWSAWIAGILVLAAGLLIAGDVIARNIWSTSPFYSFEISRYLFGATVAFGLSFALVERAHIRIDPLVKLTRGRLRSLMDVFAILATVPVAGAIAWYAWDLTVQSAELGAISNSPLGLQQWIPQAIWAVGMTWFALIALALAVLALVALVRGREAEVGRIVGLPDFGGEGAEVADLAHDVGAGSGKLQMEAAG
ncbi:TRAP transporter small permease subunit [Tistrella mobilis]|uniref:TRAP transporter small permease subunit n=1 Tax=Tistrella mobilis TaxID=171437 RepID=UPI0035578364